ncbi:hypothetical protein ACFL2A_04980 [Thermodesulfobacteriota bacterium]
MFCTNPNIGKKIDSYLESSLSEQAAKAFENHFLKCKSCFNEVRVHLNLEEIIEEHGNDIFPD